MVGSTPFRSCGTRSGPATLREDISMKTFNSFVLLVLLLAQTASSQAADLSGAWASEASACAQVFTKRNNKFAFKPDADLYAGGLIVEGKKITGTFQKCTVKS